MNSPGRWIFKKLARKEPVYVISHERSGTHFAINNLFKNTYMTQHLHYVGDWLGPYDDPSTRWNHLDDFRAAWPEIRQRGGIIKSHCDAEIFRARFPAAPVVYVLRDARDTLVSFFHYLNRDELYTSNPGLEDQRCADFSTFLRRPLSNYLRMGFYSSDNFHNVVGRWASHVSGWLEFPGVTVLRYEELAADFRKAVKRVARDVGLVPRLFQSPVAIGEAASVLPRKGIVGDWKNHFSDEDHTFLRNETARYGLTPEGTLL